MSSEIKANTISEVTSANGVSIDGVLLKDSQVSASAGGAMCLIEKATASATTDIDFTGINLLTQYRNIVFYLSNIKPSSDNSILRMVVATSGTAFDEDAHYLHVANRNYYNGSGASGNVAINENKNAIFYSQYVGNQAVDASLTEADGGFSGVINCIGFPHDVEYHQTTWTGTQGNNDGYLINFVGGGRYCENSLPITAVRFDFTSGTVLSGIIAMYGIKDA